MSSSTITSATALGGQGGDAREVCAQPPQGERRSWGENLSASMKGLYAFLRLSPVDGYSQKEREFLNSLYESDARKFEELTSPPGSPTAGELAEKGAAAVVTTASSGASASTGSSMASANATPKEFRDITVTTTGLESGRGSRRPLPGGDRASSNNRSSSRPSSPLGSIISGIFGKRPRSRPQSPSTTGGLEEGEAQMGRSTSSPPIPTVDNGEDQGRAFSASASAVQEGLQPIDTSGSCSDPPGYVEQLSLAEGHDFSDLAASGALKIAGRDDQGRVVVMVTPQTCMPSSDTADHNNNNSEDFTSDQNQGKRCHEEGAKDGDHTTNPSLALGRLLLYFILLLDQVVNEPYVVVYCNTQMTWLSWGRFSFLAQLHGLLPQRFKRNIKKLIVVHPTPVLRMFFVFGRLFLKPQFYSKLVYVEHVMDLMDHLPREVIKELPDLVFLYDIPAFDRYSHLGNLPVAIPHAEGDREVRAHARSPARISGRTWASASERGGASRYSAVLAGPHKVLGRQPYSRSLQPRLRGGDETVDEEEELRYRQFGGGRSPREAALAELNSEGDEQGGGKEEASGRGGLRPAHIATGRRSQWQKGDMAAALEMHRKTLLKSQSRRDSAQDAYSGTARSDEESGDVGFRAGATSGQKAVRVMGGNLVQLASCSGPAGGCVAGQIPWIVERCVTYLSAEERLKSIGLFRIAGDVRELMQLRDAVERGAQAVNWDADTEGMLLGVNEVDDSGALLIQDRNTIAQLLKAYFRELEDPIIPFESYSKVIAITRAAEDCTEEWIRAMRVILGCVPSAHYSTLKYLFTFLGKVASASSENRMTAENLAIVWAPNVIRPKDMNPFITLRDLKFQTDAVHWLIDCQSEILCDDF